MKALNNVQDDTVVLENSHALQLGLTTQEAEKQLKAHGENVLKDQKQKSVLQHVLASFRDITILILLFAAIMSTYVALQNHPDNLTEPLVIFGMIILSIALSVREQINAQKSMNALKEYSVQKCKVMRDGAVTYINAAHLVPEDIILLDTGDRVPADAKILHAFSLMVDESLLTGESEAMIKEAANALEDGDFGIASNKIYSGSLVLSGKCTAVVEYTGVDTEIGKISKLLSNETAQLSPLQLRMQELGKKLSMVAILSALIALAIGWLYGNDMTSMLMVAISVAVAAIPEVMPIVVTISLSYGIGNMAKRNTIVHTPTAIETIGNISVICTDKTGTLTQNKMRIERIWTVDSKVKCANEALEECEKHLLTLLLLSSSADLTKDSTVGNPTELAIIDMAYSNMDDISIRLSGYKKIHEIPFDSTRKRMTVLYETNAGYCVITKGAMDYLPLAYREEFVHKVQSVHDDFAENALRVIGVGVKYYEKLPQDLSADALETDLTLCGCVGIIDPPRPESAFAVHTAKQAGIKTVMITGDHLHTAKAIAKELGILYDNKKIMDGTTLNAMSDQELEHVIGEYRVFARTSPSDKIRIVKAFQRTGEIVAMTGDGVNDAPALKAADVGVAMGSGTDVAKEAADMILLDDHFATMISAIEEGRRVYSNIRKSIYAMLGCNASAITIVLFSLLFGWGAPVTAIQLLIIKVVADGMPGFSLCVEKAEPDIMQQPPIPKGTSIFADGMISKIVTISLVFTIATLLPIYIGNHFSIGGVPSTPMIVQTITFVIMGYTTIIHMYNCRSHLSIFQVGFCGNKLLLGTTILGMLIMVALTAIPPVAALLHLTSLGFWHWILIMMLSITPLVFVEIQKKLGLFHKM